MKGRIMISDTAGTEQRLPVYIGNEAISALFDYIKEHGLEKFRIVSDENTYQALGKSVDQALKSRGYDVTVTLLKGEEIVADEHYLIEVFLTLDRQERTFIAVGSGTLTDITRFVSHRTRSAFISMPTASSVDGFTSIGAPLVVGGLKQSILCQPPMALFADLPTLCAAPPLLTAAGFGDMVGKLLSIADWKLGNVLWDEPYDEAISQHSRRAALLCAEHAEEIGRRTPESVRMLMDGLIESGFCMLDFGNSSPASGAEHHISHYWEMKLLVENRRALFHGAKVGVASVISCGWYDAIRNLSRDQAAALLINARRPDPEAIEREIRAVYARVAEELIVEQAPFIRMSAQTFAGLKERIVERWDEVLEIAAHVPTAQQMTEWLRKANAPLTGEQLGLYAEEVRLAKEYSHYLRKRFTINKLRLIFGINGSLPDRAG